MKPSTPARPSLACHTRMAPSGPTWPGGAE
ncbi:hypothetical protein [Caudoviricetes sp.]|nr:hypothetical protein [Caudoviricetes sp.]UOF81905.1 hypothetical protein [Caudoviricetes sp.]